MLSIAESLFGDSGSPAASGTLTAFFAIFAVMPLILVMSAIPVAMASPEVTVHRMQHYDFQGTPRGCRNSLLNLEATTVHQFSESFARKCVIVRLLDLVAKPGAYEELLRQTVAGGILILLPNDERIRALSPDNMETLYQLEKIMLADSTVTPVYFAHETEELANVHEQIDRSKGLKVGNSSSAWQYASMVLSNAYQVSVAGTQTTPVKDPVMTNIEGRLFTQANDDQLPTIVVTAHYDSFGVAPGLAVGGDTNGSGVVALIELARLFNKMYASPRSQVKANIIFLLSAGGKLSYLGAKKWIEEQLDNSENSLLQESLFVMSLDSLGSDKDELFMHVSKVPKEKSPAALFFKSYLDAGARRGVNVTMINKKINLADETLAWEHERFTFRRLPAFTVSSSSTHKSSGRSSIFDSCSHADTDSLAKNIEIIAEALASQAFPQVRGKDLEIFTNELEVSQGFVQKMFSQVCSQPRSQQLLLTQLNGKTYTLAPFLSTLELVLKRFIKNVELHHFKLDQREPEVIFYEPFSTKMNIYNVKHALFDLVISAGIGVYLTALFFFLSYFDKLHNLLKYLKPSPPASSNGISKGNKQQ